MITFTRLSSATLLRRLVPVVLLVALAASLASATARADLAAVSPSLDPGTGFPVYYQDSTGLRLQMCVGAPNCGVAGALPNPTAAPSVPGNFPTAGEAPYFSATATFTNGTAKVVYVATVAGAFLNGTVATGDQIAFNRVRVTGTGLAPNTTYTVTEPYGTESFTTDAGGTGRVTIGGAGAPGVFTTGVTGPVGPFLRWDTGAPAGFIGDGVSPHTVTGSPTATNSVTVAGTDVGGAGVNTVTTDQFVVIGRLADNTPGGLALSAATDTGASHTDGITSNTTPTVTGITAASGASVALSVDGVKAATGVASGNTFSIPLTTPLANGVHAITAIATDPATGTPSAASAPLSVTVDTVAPAAPTTPATAGAIAAGSTGTFTGTAEAGATVDIQSDAAPIGTATASAGGAYSVTSTAFVAGTHHITATATDVAGNVSPASAALLLDVKPNFGPPLLSPLTPQLDSASDSGRSNQDGITNVVKPTFTGTSAFASGTVTLFADGSQIATGAISGGAYSLRSTSSLADGTHLITVVAADDTGHPTSPSAPLRITIDTKAPAVPSTPASTTGTKLLASAAASFGGSADDGSLVTIFADGSRIGSGIAVSGSYFATSTGPLAVGSHTITATATDIAGNSSAASGGLAVSVGDTPQAQVQVPPTGTSQVTAPAIKQSVLVKARRTGRVVLVTTSVNVSQPGTLDVRVLDAKGHALPLLKGSLLGTAAAGDGRTPGFRVTLPAAGNVALHLRLAGALVKAGKTYRISLRAASSAGAGSPLAIAFRLGSRK
jgi:large repetitive protein